MYYTAVFYNALSLGAVYGVFIAHKNVIYVLYFNILKCSLTRDGVRCVHSSQECYIYIDRYIYLAGVSKRLSTVTSPGSRVPPSQTFQSQALTKMATV